MSQCARSLSVRGSPECLGLGGQGLSVTLRMYSSGAGVGCSPSLPHLIGVDPAACEV